MSLYRNNDTSGAIRSVEQFGAGTGEIIVVRADAARATEVIRALNMQPVTRVAHGKETLLVFQSATPFAGITDKLASQFGGRFAEIAQKPKPAKTFMDMNRVRGLLGTAGQILQQIAAKVEVNQALNQSSTISLASNLITVAYGTPQRIDYQKTEAMRERADWIIGSYIGDYRKPDELEVTKSRHQGSPAAKFNKFVGANNIMVSDGMKLASQLWLSKRGNNWVDKTMGTLQASAKFVTFSGVDRDRDKPDSEKHIVRWLRENTNPISGALEWAGQFMNMFNSLYLPQIHNVGYDQISKEFKASGIKVVQKHYRSVGEVFSAKNWENFRFKDIRIISKWRFTAVMLFLSGFAAKMIAPFSQKSVDWHEVHRHAVMALEQVPENKREQLLMELSAAYLGIAKDKNLTFAQIYGTLREDVMNNYAVAKATAEVEMQHAQKAGMGPSSSVQTASIVADKLKTPVESAAHRAR